jgi:hypothetical protein
MTFGSAALSKCDRCRFHARSPYLVCAVHPEGPESDRCLDHRPQHPEEYGSYLGEVITDVPRLNQFELLGLLNRHPSFTGYCPQCGEAIAQTKPPRIHWGG